MESASSISLLLSLFGVAFLVLLNGFFVASEFAVVKIRETQLVPLIQKGHRRAHIARAVVQNLDLALSACQLGITLASLGLGWIGEPAFAVLLQPVMGWLQITSPEVQHRIAIVVGFSAITFLHIVIGEMAPKFLAINKPLPVTLWIAAPLRWFYRISHPFIWVLNESSIWVMKQFGIHAASEAELAHSPEELRLLLGSAHGQSSSTALGRHIILSALDLSQRQVRDVMRPRSEITQLDTEATLAQCLERAEKTRYSRFPLCVEGDLDRTLGVVHIKDLYGLRQRATTGAGLAGVTRPIVFVPPSCRLERLLQLLLERKLHFALVVDEYGGTLGLITLENILEELVGQIQDEFDQEVPLAERAGDGWKILGNLPIHELEELTSTRIEEEDIATTSGLVTRRLGGFPKTGDTLALGDFQLKVEAVDGPVVSRLSLTKRTDEDS